MALYAVEGDYNLVISLSLQYELQSLYLLQFILQT